MNNEVLALYIGYMDKVLSNARIDYLRKIKRSKKREALPGILPDVTVQEDIELEIESLNELTDDESLNAALRTLNQNEATVLFRLVCLEHDMRAVAREMGMDYTSISRIKHRALQKLRKALVGGVGNG